MLLTQPCVNPLKLSLVPIIYISIKTIYLYIILHNWLMKKHSFYTYNSVLFNFTFFMLNKFFCYIKKKLIKFLSYFWYFATNLLLNIYEQALIFAFICSTDEHRQCLSRPKSIIKIFNIFVFYFSIHLQISIFLIVSKKLFLLYENIYHNLYKNSFHIFLINENLLKILCSSGFLTLLLCLTLNFHAVSGHT